MAISLPNTLATTMGIELSYVPAYVDELRNNCAQLGVEINDTWKYIGCDAYSSYARALRTVLNTKGVEVQECKTDPGCVEVPTKPYNKIYKLRKITAAVTRYAKAVGLSPNASWTVGGGAHIHTGIPTFADDYNQQQRVSYAYRAYMQVWQAKNPWFAWAFAGCNDFVNAHTLARNNLQGETESLDSLQLQYNYYVSQIREYKQYIVEYTNRLHTVEGWRDSWSNNYYKGEIKDYLRSMKRYMKYMLSYKKKIAEAKNNTNTFFVRAENISLTETKNYAITSRSHTMEFRCFVMPATNKGLDKQIAITNAIVSHCIDEVKVMQELNLFEIDLRGTYENSECRTMTYKQAKQGFITMLRQLGFSESDYREYIYNMAKRFRIRRKHGEV